MAINQRKILSVIASAQIFLLLTVRVNYGGGALRAFNKNEDKNPTIIKVVKSAPETPLASIMGHVPPSKHPKASRETLECDLPTLV